MDPIGTTAVKRDKNGNIIGYTQNGKSYNAQAGTAFEFDKTGATAKTVSTTPKTDIGDIYTQEQELMAEQQKGLEGQVKASEEAVAAAGLAGEASLAAARRGAAANLAAQRGMGESGRASVLGRGAARDAAITQTGIRGQTASDVAEASATAAQARSDAAIAKQAFIDKQKIYTQEASDAAARAEEIISENTGTMFTTESDTRKMIQQLEAERNKAVSPAAKKAFQSKIDAIKGGTLDTDWSLDSYSW